MQTVLTVMRFINSVNSINIQNLALSPENLTWKILAWL